jgi:predicted amidohydrolase YtcJ
MAEPDNPRRRRLLLGAAAAVAGSACLRRTPKEPAMAELVVHNARITTLDPARPAASAIAVADGVVLAVGSDAEVMASAGPSTRVVDGGGRRLIPGLNDSHTHLIRGGLNYNLELRWDGVRDLADAMAMLRAQVARTPAPQWVRVVGGFTEQQFRQKRLPTLDELNALAPDTPVFILHLYDRALLNRAALRAVGYTRDTPDPPGGRIERDRSGNPTGLLLAEPNALILYATLGLGPKLPPDYQENSTRQFMRELNRLGITSVIDAGGGFQNYPEDYAVIQRLHAADQLTVRIAYNLFTQNPGRELEDFRRWTEMLAAGSGDAMLRHNGAGEMLVFSAADFELFNQPRPDLPARMEPDLEAVVELLVRQRWPFRIHATYDESIGRVLDVYEKVDARMPFAGLHWTIDHAETISERNIERVRALGGGIAIQHRMAFQGEAFAERHGAQATARTPPVRRMLESGVPVGAGTDATRVASYNPWTALYWLVSGRSLGGLQLYPDGNRLERAEALALWTRGSAWFSGEQARKGRLAPGQFADFALLSVDYFAVPEAQILDIESVLTVVGGRIVHGHDGFAGLAPALPPPMPDWSPVGHRISPGNNLALAQAGAAGLPGHRHAPGTGCAVHGRDRSAIAAVPAAQPAAFLGALGCACFAF